jgi:hypothetical protein
MTGSAGEGAVTLVSGLSGTGLSIRMSKESVAILVRTLWKRYRTSRRRTLGRARLVTVGVTAVPGEHGCFGEESAEILMTGV